MRMCCVHRFLDFHGAGLFPNWKIKYLVVGTFNPSWNNPSGNNADYFYGRSAYFWTLLPRFRNAPSLAQSSVQQKVAFCKSNGVGFTDLVERIEGAHYNNRQHRAWVLSYKDSDLLNFGAGLLSNTAAILTYINQNPVLERIYFTLLGGGISYISQQIAAIEQHCTALRQNTQRNIYTHRLHSPTGMGLGKGTPRENKLTHRWYTQGMNHMVPRGGGFALSNYTYQPFP